MSRTWAGPQNGVKGMLRGETRMTRRQNDPAMHLPADVAEARAVATVAPRHLPA